MDVSSGIGVGRFKKSNGIERRILNLKKGSNVSEKKYCLEGRRIIDLNFFGRKFDSGCVSCGKSLKWSDIIRESVFGYASIFHFQCSECGDVSKICTSDTHAMQGYYYKNKRKPYAVNVKAALALIHGGIGETHMNAISTTFGIPPITFKTLKKRERDVGPEIEKCAKLSCRAASNEERNSIVNARNLDKVSKTRVSIEKDTENVQMTFDQALEYLENFADEEEEADDTELSQKARKADDTVRSQVRDFCDEDIVDRSVAERDYGATDSIHIDNVSGENARATPSLFEFKNQFNPQHTKLIDATVSQDAAWPKRSRGMNSLSGWGHVIGQTTKRCLNFATRVKQCKKCSFYKKRNRNVPKHDCRVNWSKSAKSMEADIAVQLHTEAKENGLRYKAVIGDEDSSAIKHIKEKVNSDIEKYSDIGHIKRSVSNKLDELSKKHRSLTRTVKASFLTNFTFAYHQNNNKSEDDMRTAMGNLVPHMYGDHENCGFHTSGSATYKHTNLPHGKDLSDKELRADLEGLMKPFVANSRKLMTTGHSQANESLNSIAWSKAPKFRNYTLSESFDYRCAAAVCQFNDGRSYVDKVCLTASLTPQKITHSYNERKDRKRRYQREYKQGKTFKKARKRLKKERSKNEIVYAVKEGITYSTDCLLNNSDNLDITCIPEKNENIEMDAENIIPVYFDIETTKLGHSAEIVQLAAYVDSSSSYNAYIMPTGSISESARAVTGFKIEIQDGVKKMFQNGKPVQTVDRQTGLASFIAWLDAISSNKKILIAHNGSRFDFPILFNQLESSQLINEVKTKIYGVCDSIHVLKSSFKTRISKGFSLGVVYEEITGTKFDGHDALYDAKAIAEVFKKSQISDTQIIESSATIASAVNATQCNKSLKEAVDAFEFSINNKKDKIVSQTIAKKICRSGLTYEMLKLAHFRDREQGVRAILSEKVGKSARVTNRSSIIKSLSSYFERI